MSKPGLFDEFPQVSAKQWKQKIQYDLKGADYNENLVWESPEGIKVKPFYHAEDLDKPTPSQGNGKWEIAQVVYAGDVSKANSKALDILKKGVETLVFAVPNPKVDLVGLLEGIDLAKVPVHFNFGFLAIKPIQTLLAFTKDKEAHVFFHVDPIGNLARTGNWHESQKKDESILGEL